MYAPQVPIRPRLLGAAMLLQRGTAVARRTAVRVWLARKLAQFVDGIDIRRRRVGEAFDLAEHEARLLIAEGYAAPDRRIVADRRETSRDATERRALIPEEPEPLGAADDVASIAQVDESAATSVGLDLSRVATNRHPSTSPAVERLDTASQTLASRSNYPEQ